MGRMKERAMDQGYEVQYETCQGRVIDLVYANDVQEAIGMAIMQAKPGYMLSRVIDLSSGERFTGLGKPILS